MRKQQKSWYIHIYKNNNTTKNENTRIKICWIIALHFATFSNNILLLIFLFVCIGIIRILLLLLNILKICFVTLTLFTYLYQLFIIHRWTNPYFQYRRRKLKITFKWSILLITHMNEGIQRCSQDQWDNHCTRHTQCVDSYHTEKLSSWLISSFSLPLLVYTFFLVKGYDVWIKGEFQYHGASILK